MAEQTPLLKEQYAVPSAPPPQGPPPQVPPTYQAAGGGAPPPPAYTTQPPPAQQQVTQVILPPSQVMVTGVSFSDVPIQLHCPNCQNDVMTKLDYSAGALTWIIVLVLLLLGFWFGCCLIPLCVDGLKDVNHICPVCSYQLGTHKRL